MLLCRRSKMALMLPKRKRSAACPRMQRRNRPKPKLYSLSLSPSPYVERDFLFMARDRLAKESKGLKPPCLAALCKPAVNRASDKRDSRAGYGFRSRFAPKG